jgi:AP-3 complex subunit mu
MEAPWRPRKIKYTINEVLIDVVESINCILDKNGNFIRYDITGEVVINCSLSGMPDLSVYMHIPHPFNYY